VDVHVVERDHSVHALVTASFDMFNCGATVNLTTGFPRFGASYMVAGGFAGFDPTQFSDFRASSGSTVFQPTIQSLKVPSNPAFSGDWYVWQMEYPGNTTTTVDVAYDQTISSEINGYTYVSYILGTGALWDGTIGDATVTVSTDTGGAFLLPSADEVSPPANNQASQTLPNAGLPTTSSLTQVAWHLTDFKPSFDPYVIYVPADAWQRFTTYQMRITAGSASADDYASAVQAYFDSVGRMSGGLPWVVRQGMPQPLRDRLDNAAAWANQATTLDPNDAAGFDALGDVQFVKEVRATLHIQCRPQLAPVAYQKAIDLGSSNAQGKLDDINTLVRYSLDARGLPPCSTDANSPVVNAVPDTLTDAVRAEILDAVTRANQVWQDTTNNLNVSELTGSGWVAGDLLQSDLAEVQQLRSAGHRRANTNTDFQVVDVTLDTPGHAVVHTRVRGHHINGYGSRAPADSADHLSRDVHRRVSKRLLDRHAERRLGNALALGYVHVLRHRDICARTLFDQSVTNERIGLSPDTRGGVARAEGSRWRGSQQIECVGIGINVRLQREASPAIQQLRR